ncbi:MAG: response regulator transcription factor [Acidobacteria bacterium]|nr:response regulator transcription factor [Acidobacteriota bacterium]
MSLVRVVVADDAEVLRSLLCRAIDRDGRLEVVAEAANGREAVEHVRALRPDVLLLDLSMPVLDGMEVLRELAGAVPVVVLTGYGESDLGGQCRDLGARGFVEKGAPMQAVCDALVAAAVGS